MEDIALTAGEEDSWGQFIDITEEDEEEGEEVIRISEVLPHQTRRLKRFRCSPVSENCAEHHRSAGTRRSWKEGKTNPF